ncbi:MAG TPA: ABC transporter permease [Candidatus Nanopelagicales bacterium]|jgi:ABC-2 type transport system permease protein|nr:ABC transporter permease [Candidatus Nanopelagicales bacterium]
MSAVAGAGSFTPRPGAAPRARIVLAQTAAEVRATVRNGEQLLLTLVIPVVLLVGLSRASIVSLGDGPAIDLVAPGVLALAVLSTAFTSLAIATGFERRYGVLKLLGATPLGRPGLVAAKSLAVLAVEVVQLALLVVIAELLGWDPAGSWPAAAVLLVLGTLTFSALALLLAGTLRAEATLAAANAVYLLLLLGGGVVVPIEKLPGPLADLARLLPSGALGEGLRDVLIRGDGLAALLGPIVVLLVWGVAAALLAGRTFRWE